MVWPSVKSPKILFQLTTTKTWKDSHTQSCQIPDNCLKNLIPINSHFETIASHTAVADKTPSSDCTQSTNNTVFMYKIAPIHTAGWCKPLSVFLSKKKKKKDTCRPFWQDTIIMECTISTTNTLLFTLFRYASAFAKVGKCMHGDDECLDNMGSKECHISWVGCKISRHYGG